MIYLITGMPGNGKTLYAVDFIKKAVEKGRKVYSDIKGLTLPGVEPAPDDWRTAPDGSLIVYDEAHKRFPSFKGKGRSPLDIVRDMDEHRHRGFDLMFITQWPDKVDQELFRLVGTHWHLHRAFGLQRASLCMFSRGVMNPYSATARKGADESIWDYPKDLYKVYKSSSLHTDAHKFKLPLKVKQTLISLPMILLVLWGLYWFLVPTPPEKPDAGAERSEAEPTRPLPASPSIQTMAGTPQENPAPATVPQVAGCVQSERGCRCWDVSGLQLQQSRYECERMVEQPLPINIYHQYASAQGAAPAEVRGDEGGAAASSVVRYKAGQRPDVFPRSPSYTGETWTPPTTTL